MRAVKGDWLGLRSVDKGAGPEVGVLPGQAPGVGQEGEGGQGGARQVVTQEPPVAGGAGQQEPGDRPQ